MHLSISARKDLIAFSSWIHCEEQVVMKGIRSWPACYTTQRCLHGSLTLKYNIERYILKYSALQVRIYIVYALRLFLNTTSAA